MLAGDVVYFWQVEADPSLLATGLLLGLPFAEGGDFRVRIQYDQVFEAAPSLATIAADPRLSKLPVFKTRQGTNFQISVDQAAALSELLGPLAPKVNLISSPSPTSIETPTGFHEALIRLLWYPPWRRAFLLFILATMAAFAVWKSLPDTAKESVINTMRNGPRNGRDKVSGGKTVPDPFSTYDILFDGRNAIDGFSIKGQGGQLWTGLHPYSIPVGNKGDGTLTFGPGGILNIRRTNTDGRFELIVQQYTYRDRGMRFIPPDELIMGGRRLRVLCEAKVVGGTHTLRFVVNALSGQQLANYTETITDNQWKRVDVYLESSAAEESTVRIYDEATSAPSSLQLKGLVILQKK